MKNLINTIKYRNTYIFGKVYSYFPMFFAADVALTLSVIGGCIYYFVQAV